MVTILSVIILIQSLLIFSQFKRNNRIVKELLTENKKIFLLLDTLHAGLCNPMFKEVYNDIRKIPIDNIPESSKDFFEMLGRINNEKFIQTLSFFQERINESEDIEKKTLYEEKLEKLNEIKVLIDTIDSDSSKEHLELMYRELQNSIEKFNDN